MRKSTDNSKRIVEPQERWGTWEDAEYWRKEDFLRFSPAQRLNWLCEMLILGYRSGAISPYREETTK